MPQTRAVLRPERFAGAVRVRLASSGGAFNGAKLAGTPLGAAAVAGIATSIFVLVSLLSGQAASVRALWARIAVQVAGSRIAAAGLFMVGWAVRGAAHVPP